MEIPNVQLKPETMQQARYYWSAMHTGPFTQQEILTHLKGVNTTIGELLHLRGELTKAQVPTHQLVTGIRAMEEIKELLVMMATKKQLTRKGEFVLADKEFNNNFRRRDVVRLFVIHCKIQLRGWRARKKSSSS